MAIKNKRKTKKATIDSDNFLVILLPQNNIYPPNIYIQYELVLCKQFIICTYNEKIPKSGDFYKSIFFSTR